MHIHYTMSKTMALWSITKAKKNETKQNKKIHVEFKTQKTIEEMSFYVLTGFNSSSIYDGKFQINPITFENYLFFPTF